MTVSYRTAIFLFSLIACAVAWTQTAPPTSRPVITLADAIHLAEVNASQFRLAVTQAGLAHEDKVQARAALLPNISYTTGAVYTQRNGSDTGVFIAANGPREYLSQGVVAENLSVSDIADYRKATALEAVARANREIARRGLVATVVQDYYGAIVAHNKFLNAQAAADEAQRFVKLSQQLENGGEVAHSDVIKAQLQANDRTVAMQDAKLAEDSAKLALAVLIFPNFNPDFDVANDLEQPPALPDLPQIQELAGRNNPAITAAVEAMKASQHELSASVAGHLPSLTFNYFYGIDAPRYALRMDGINNLGSQWAATLNLPIFDWGAVQSKVKQAQLQRDLARVQLSEAQRQALANLRQFYEEAQTARAQIDVQKQSADLAAESLRLTTLRYQGGEATALEVVDAQNTLVQARNNYNDALVRYRLAVANLQTLTGNF